MKAVEIEEIYQDNELYDNKLTSLDSVTNKRDHSSGNELANKKIYRR